MGQLLGLVNSVVIYAGLRNSSGDFGYRERIYYSSSVINS